MSSKNLFIIAGCIGAGKTTASFNILPTILNCKEFINVDEIAKGLSPFQPEKVNFEAGRIMLHRIDELNQEVDFVFETTLSSKTYRQTIIKAQEQGYFVTLLFFWLRNINLAKTRVKTRVSEGGHNIPEPVIERRYERGLDNLFKLYLPICDNIMLFDNSDKKPILVMEKEKEKKITILNSDIFSKIQNGRK